MTIQEKIDALKKEFADKIAELEKQAKAEEKQSKVWKPKKGDSYWVLCAVNFAQYTWDDDATDVSLSMRGNVFKTEEEADWADQHRIVATELKHFVAENDPRPITEEDWQNEAVAKKFIVYDNEEGGVRIRSTESWLIANQVYARNTETLIKAISHIGEERLKKYYFGVEK